MASKSRHTIADDDTSEVLTGYRMVDRLESPFTGPEMK